MFYAEIALWNPLEVIAQAYYNMYALVCNQTDPHLSCTAITAKVWSWCMVSVKSGWCKCKQALGLLCTHMQLLVWLCISNLFYAYDVRCTLQFTNSFFLISAQKSTLISKLLTKNSDPNQIFFWKDSFVGKPFRFKLDIYSIGT